MEAVNKKIIKQIFILQQYHLPYYFHFSIDSQWSGLVNALSGQFCASLNYLQRSVSVSPMHTFKPMGLWPADKLNASTYLRYATLPREMVCTENLTPWRKLLPCGNKVCLSLLSVLPEIILSTVRSRVDGALEYRS